MVSVKGTTPAASHTTQASGSGQTAATTASAQKRKATNLPPGMPPSRKQKQSGAGKSTPNGREDLPKWNEEVKSMGALGSGITEVDKGKINNLANAGEQLKQQESTANLSAHPEKPLDSPVSAFMRTTPDQLYSKSAAPKAGDHSPSVSAVEKVDSAETRILGRKAKPTPTGFNVNEHKVPTLQFHTKPFYDGTQHDYAKDSAAHTVFTSMREMHQAGEQGKGTLGSDGKSEKHANMSELLDATARAYSPYNARGERVVSPVDPSKDRFTSPAVKHGVQERFRPLSEDAAGNRLDQLRKAREAEFSAESPLPRVHINTDGTKGEKLNTGEVTRREPAAKQDANGDASANRPIERVKSDRGVSPFVGQQMMNMWHRENLGQAPHGPDPSNPPMHNAPRQPRAPGQFPTQLPLGGRIQQQQAEAQEQWNSLSPAQQQAQKAETSANVSRLGKEPPAPAADDAMDVDS
ncbi:hypothetical protein G3N95_01940 [Paraburkholderia sp. Tr-20389]|uniref:hypothetical protein n=1 Tax=Paraburkholderia sp. Tr-20389 TaxID=2703903 RepID=UPI00197D426E|nr:hypothetical protein [Paraburkholderia sp. Tr-20389]MBN3751682.1 hypothetical protein [Paraburkholderia sp. Tr-20389]